MKTLTERGFTLIELMIVVAVVGILAAIAYPSYQEHVRKSRRADAKAVLVEAAQYMERVYTEKFDYQEGSPLPEVLNKSPSDSDPNAARFYNISFVSGTLSANEFTLQAVPIGAQSDDRCGTLTLTHTGQKGQKSGMDTNECWF